MKLKKQVWLIWLSALGLAATTALPVSSAEQVYVTYFLFERSISVSALETYAKEGKLTEELAVYARYLKPEQLQELRAALQERIDLDPVTISQFLYSPVGERLLQRVSQVIQPQSKTSGYYALRSALILAAADPGGLTALSLLRNFPDQGIRVDLSKGVEIFQQIQQVVRQTNIAVAAIQQQSQAEAKRLSNISPGAIQALERRGAYAWDKVSFQLRDATSRRLALTGSPRTFPVDVYLPKLAQPQAQPVIVISHGLGSNRESFSYLAEHLASFGFVVAVPEHPGSSASQLSALLDGKTGDVSEPSEFVNRPLDVQFLLDELERRSANLPRGTTKPDPLFQGRLNLQQVGVIGQSFGGYTALALAGAKLNFEQLQVDCGPRLNESLNISLLLQCQAFSLPKRDYNLADPRIKAAIAINPIDSSVFAQPGLSQIKVPVMLVAGSADTVAPPLAEQIQPFTWLTSPEKYLVLIDGATHFSGIGASAPSTQVISVPTGLIGNAPDLTRRYLQVLSVAFMQTYAANKSSFAKLLTPTAISHLGREPLNLSLIRQLTPASLETILSSQPATSNTKR